MSLSATSDVGGGVAGRRPEALEVAAWRDTLLALESFDLARIALLERAQVECLRALDGLQLALLLEIERLDRFPVGALILLELDPTARIAPLRGTSNGPGNGAGLSVRRLGRSACPSKRQDGCDQDSDERPSR